MNHTTIEKLIQMRLTKMAESFRQQITDNQFQDLSFEERFGMLVDHEWSRRRHNKLDRLIANAKFRYPQACIEDIDYHGDRKLDRDQILRLAGCGYIEQRHNLIIMGAAGNGKSYLGCAFGMAACRNYYSVRYIRLPELLDDLAIARGEGDYKKVMRQYKKIRLLILDEWLLSPLTDSQARELLELIEARYQNASTVFCSQFPPKEWYDRIGEMTLADAILDRIVHDSHTIFIDGQVSMRERLGISKKKD